MKRGRKRKYAKEVVDKGGRIGLTKKGKGKRVIDRGGKIGLRKILFK